MPPVFTLNLTPRPASLIAELELRDAQGAQLGYREVDFATLPPSLVHGLFNLRDYIQHYATPGKTPEALVDDIGVFLGRDVLGDLLTPLAKGQMERNLTVNLPELSDHPLATALGRVPWEIARPAPGQPSLAERNLLIRAQAGAAPDAAEALPLRDGQPVKLLLVFAEAPGSSPLAMRQERRELLEMFKSQVFPKRKLAVDVLAHGVTRARLRQQIKDRGGYHVLHWSGHGHVNLLELYGADGRAEHIGGEELAELFVQAGGYIPRLVFLSACHSGDLGEIRDWAEFKARVEGRETATKDSAERPVAERLDEQPGYTGTAHRLLKAGVPAVVAMRYAVGDDYARDLARAFYHNLFADRAPKPVAAALNQARTQLRLDTGTTSGYDPCDHATPVHHGGDEALPPPPGRSDNLEPSEPRPPQTIAELRIREHPNFVGRARELAGLGARWIGEGGAEAKPVALILAMGGMGKTALAAEALDLWWRGFDWVFVFQAKPHPLPLEEFLRDLHTRLAEQQGVYAHRVAQYPAEAIYRPADEGFRGEQRYARLRENLLKTLREEAVLLVLDNFESNLKPSPQPSPAGRGGLAFPEQGFACQDSEWDKLLAAFAEGLADSRSRVLLTSRDQPAALGKDLHRVRLGPLPTGEAVLFIRKQPDLRKLIFGSGAEQALAARLLDASRGHPLLLDRLARLLAGGWRAELEQALDALEQRKDFAKLPEWFAQAADSAEERAYLHDALETSLDRLLTQAGAEARLLLWLLALADDPVTFDLLEWVWQGKSQQQRQHSVIPARTPESSHMDVNLPADTLVQSNTDAGGVLPSMALDSGIPAGMTESQAQTLTPALSHGERVPKAAPGADAKPLLHRLIVAGLVTEEKTHEADANADYFCHELVRERIEAWMEQNPAERQNRDEAAVRRLYGEWLVAAFNELFHQNQAVAQEAGRRALGHFVRTGAYGQLGGFASNLIKALYVF